MTKKKIVIAVLLIIFTSLLIVLVKSALPEPAVIGQGPATLMTVTMPWNAQAVEIPAPVIFPEWGKQTSEYRHWHWKKNVRDFITFDLEGNKYIAHGLGFVKDSQTGQLYPLISSVERINQDGLRECCTLYERQGPVEWYQCDEQDNKIIRISRSSVGIEVVFLGENEKKYKEWNVNRNGQIYWESVRQDDGNWTCTYDMRELRTDEDVPWDDSLRQFMEYYPGND